VPGGQRAHAHGNHEHAPRGPAGSRRIVSYNSQFYLFMLHRFVESIKPFAASLGGPGLLLIAFLDSSFLSFPEVPDLLLVYLVVQHPERALFYVAMVTLGSAAGCVAIYLVARKGGEAMMRRFSPALAERALLAIRRHGVLAVLVPAILPPPAPFKIFVILAGVAGIPAGSFTLAIVTGRALRFTIEALLAYHYGSRAMAYINENMGRLSLWTAVALTLLGIAFVAWRRRKKRLLPLS
jgi:membrane protein YqaA with SNARE-associated domain